MEVMDSMHRISIVIATRNRATELLQTLHSVLETRVPEDIRVQLVVVNNNSTDHTSATLQKLAPRLRERFDLVLLTEHEAGKARSLNLALSHATGSVLLFTDDDVRVPVNWIEGMTRPIFEGHCDAVAGGIRLAAELMRPWMAGEHLDYLACTSHKKGRKDHPTVGANCAIARSLVENAGRYDPEVGPGAIGHSEDLFLWLKMRALKARIQMRFDVEVEHHPDPERLCRRAFLKMAEHNGHWHAYVDYHWAHTVRRLPRLSLIKAVFNLWKRRLAYFSEWRSHPVVPDWELKAIAEVHFRKAYLEERRAPRKYEALALKKNHGAMPLLSLTSLNASPSN